jgi:hypothetical protein
LTLNGCFGFEESVFIRRHMMPRHELEAFYKATHNACRYVLQPSPRLIQELVQAWRVLGRRSSI